MSNPENLTIYHNPNCKKSKETLSLIRENGIEPQIVEYLKNPPSPEKLDTIFNKLGKNPTAIIRKQEKVFKEYFKDKHLSREDWLTVLNENPKLIERPIVIKDQKAVIGRPPERVLELI